MYWLLDLAARFLRPPALGREILYWSHESPPQAFAGRAATVPSGDVLLAISVLRAGKPLRAWAGWADCRICGEALGSRDVGVLGFVWPERAEHYVERHEVWTPGLTELVLAARGRA
jgi:hypothetical protein